MTQRTLLIAGLALVAAGILVGGVAEPILEQSVGAQQAQQQEPPQSKDPGRGSGVFPGRGRGVLPGGPAYPGFPGGPRRPFRPRPSPSPTATPAQ